MEMPQEEVKAALAHALAASQDPVEKKPKPTEPPLPPPDFPPPGQEKEEEEEEEEQGQDSSPLKVLLRDAQVFPRKA